MATYKTTDLMNLFSELLIDGHFTVNISEIEADDEYPASLHFEVPCEDSYACDSIDSLPDGSKVTLDTGKDCVAAFTPVEISCLHHSVSNALEYYKECEKSPSYSRDEKSKIKSASVEARNMQAKLVKILKNYL